MNYKVIAGLFTIITAASALGMQPKELKPKQLKAKQLQKPPAGFENKKVESLGHLNDYANRRDLLEESLSNAPRIVHEFIANLSDPNFDKSQLKQIVLVGPTGCGKSVLTRSIAHALKRDCLFVSACDLLCSYRHGTEKKIRALFEQLSESKPQPILALDEIGIIGGGKNPVHKDQIEALQAMCSLLDEQSQNNDFLMIGTTCDPESIAPTLRNKCNIMQIPQIPVSPRMLLTAISKHPKYSLAAECDQKYLEALAQRAKIFSIRCIDGIVETAVVNAYAEKRVVITKKDLDDACERALYNRRTFTSLPME